MPNNATGTKLKQKIGEDEYKTQKAEYVKAYRAKQRQLKKNVGENQRTVNTLTDAVKSRKGLKGIIIITN